MITYDGPFPTPPANLLRGAVGWRHLYKPAGPGRWEPDGFIVVYPHHLIHADMDGTPYRDLMLHGVR